MADYLLSLYDNARDSDFCIESEDGKLHLHKLILCQNDYFRTLFTTKIGSGVNTIKVPCLKAARVLCKYFYSARLDLGGQTREEFLETVKLAKEWLMPARLSTL